MFGYVKPYAPELKVRENELYNAVYCGLCRSMGRLTGALSRLALSYDIAFLALVLSAYEGESFDVEQKRCFVHPLKKNPVAKDCEILRYCSAVSAELAYRDLLDKIKDSKGLRRLFIRAASPVFARARRKAKKKYDFDDGFIDRTLSELYKLEEERSPSPDRAADVFGRLLGYFFSYGVSDENKPSAETVGVNVGRFIYLCDAADDIEKDEKSGAYNPLLLHEGEKREKLDRAFSAMCVWADTAAGEVLLECRPCSEADIAVNVLKLGMPDAAKKTTDKKGKTDGKRSV